MRDTQLGRREFLRYSAVGIALTKMPLYGANLVSNRDRFGGWIGKKFKPTGFFRVEKDKRWWLVTPEGNAFLSFGINHLYPDLWKQDYNRQAWQKRLGVDDLNTPQFAPALRAWFLRTCRE